MGGEGGMENLIADHGRQSGAREVLNQVLYCDMKLYLEGDILPKVDRASMANSLEVRVPFLNARLLELPAGCRSGSSCAALPASTYCDWLLRIYYLTPLSTAAKKVLTCPWPSG